MLLIIALLSIPLGVALIAILLRFLANNNKAEYISLAIAFIGAFSGLTLAQYTSNISDQLSYKTNTLGILKAAKVSTTNALFEVRQRIGIANYAQKLEQEGKEQVIKPSPISMKLPMTL